MISITVPEPTAAALSKNRELVELRSPDGTLIGFFAPISLEHAAKYAQAATKAEPHTAQRIQPEGTPVSTTDLLNRLGSIGQR
jgi:hypothetical protein